jgi:hypothetical protein
MSKREYAIDPPPDVKVKLSDGCALDGKTDEHTHQQDEWQDHIDRQDYRHG